MPDDDVLLPARSGFVVHFVRQTQRKQVVRCELNARGGQWVLVLLQEELRYMLDDDMLLSLGGLSCALWLRLSRSKNVAR